MANLSGINCSVADTCSSSIALFPHADSQPNPIIHISLIQHIKKISRVNSSVVHDLFLMPVWALVWVEMRVGEVVGRSISRIVETSVEGREEVNGLEGGGSVNGIVSGSGYCWK
jgi:hypothetical protein